MPSSLAYIVSLYGHECRMWRRARHVKAKRKAHKGYVIDVVLNRCDQRSMAFVNVVCLGC